MASGAKGCLFALVPGGGGWSLSRPLTTGVGNPSSPTAGLGWSLGLSVAKRRPHHTELPGLPDQRGRNHLRRVHLVIYPPVQIRARAPLAHLHIHTYTYTSTRTPHTLTNTYTRPQTHIHSHETTCARAYVIHARDTRTPEETPTHVHGYRHPAYMHVRTRPRNAHTRSRIYTYALRTRRTKRRGAARPRTWCTTRWTEDRAESWVAGSR